MVYRSRSPVSARVARSASFCATAPDRVANQLTPVREALTSVADSLAAHFGEWGAVSRFSVSPSPATSSRDQEADPAMQQMSFEEHIKTMFRPRDQQSMQFAFDLWSYDDVAANADDILARVRAGTMPCDGAWPKEQVDAFQNWVDAGKPQ